MSYALAGGVIFLLAVAGATLLVRKPVPGRQRQTRILLFLLYFWVLVFTQLVVAALGYALLGR